MSPDWDVNDELRKLNAAIQQAPQRKRELITEWHQRTREQHGAEAAETALLLLNIVNVREDNQALPQQSTTKPRQTNRTGTQRRKLLILTGTITALAMIAALSITRVGQIPLPPVVDQQRFPRLPPSGTNNVWYHQANSPTVFVFVHGIFSDSTTCWYYDHPTDTTQDEYWPDLITRDQRLERPAVFLGGYATSIDSGPYDTRQAADELRRALVRNHLLEKRRIIFVAHSTGGIITRYLLTKHPDLFRGKHVGLVLYASPSMGSEFAQLLGGLSAIYGNRLGQELKPDSPTLISLDNDFRDLLQNPNSNPEQPRITGAEAIENFFIIHRRLLPDKTLLVRETSASRYFGAPVYLRRTDHFSIVKPNAINHPAHEFLIDFYHKYNKDARLNHTATLVQNVQQKTTSTETRTVAEQLIIIEPQQGAIVPRNPPIAFTYANIPANHNLWLIVTGDEPPPASDPDLYWPIGHMPFGDGLSVISHEDIVRNDPTLRTWHSKVPARHAWFSDAGKRYRLELVAVDETGDRRLGREYEINARAGFTGVSRQKSYDYHRDIKAHAKPMHVTRENN